MIVVATTTSLPEWIGGVRNWDYRYTWLREASFTLTSLYVAGYRRKAQAFFRGLSAVAARQPTPLQIMYGIEGERTLTDQKQWDSYGGILGAAYIFEREGDLLTPHQWETLRDEIDYVCAHWREPDNGMWEIRGQLQHSTIGKLMCWLTLDRGIRSAEMEGWDDDRERWAQSRDAMRASILEHG